MSQKIDLYECQNCNGIWEFEQLKDIRHYHQRVQVGEAEPSGECPKCGALCHPQDSI